MNLSPDDLDDSHQYRVEGMVMVEDDIIYDVTLQLVGQELYIEAEYNAAATADQYDALEDVYGTGPVEAKYQEIIHFLGTPPIPTEDDLSTYLEEIRQQDKVNA